MVEYLYQRPRESNLIKLAVEDLLVIVVKEGVIFIVGQFLLEPVRKS